MNPLLDQLLVGLLVAAALGWFVWRSVRRRARGKGCGGDCGCAPKKR
jgi:FeoB-associated Cys-rich membrane protein